MERKKDSQVVVIAALAIAIVFMSVGFALFAQNLQVNGTATVDAALWDIHFDPNSYAAQPGSKPITYTLDSANTTLQFETELEKPGDFATFVINAKNFGTFDADLTSITLSSLGADQQEYLEYTVQYDGVTYDATTTGLDVPLNQNQSKSLLVSVKYLEPADSTKLPSSNVDVSLTATLGYTQVTE